MGQAHISSESPPPNPVLRCISTITLNGMGARNRKTKTCWSRYACEMAVLHMTEAELAQNLALVLDHVQSGTEVIIERNDRPVAVLRPTQPSWRKLSEIMTALPESSAATLDADFVAEVQEFIDRHSAALLSY